jgi:hypothetical protein
MSVQPPPAPGSTDEYNYKTFTTSESRGKSAAFRALARVGEEAPDFSLTTPEGGTYGCHNCADKSTFSWSSALSPDRRLWARSRL